MFLVCFSHICRIQVYKVYQTSLENVCTLRKKVLSTCIETHKAFGVKVLREHLRRASLWFLSSRLQRCSFFSASNSNSSKLKFVPCPMWFLLTGYRFIFESTDVEYITSVKLTGHSYNSVMYCILMNSLVFCSCLSVYSSSRRLSHSGIFRR